MSVAQVVEGWRAGMAAGGREAPLTDCVSHEGLKQHCLLVCQPVRGFVAVEVKLPSPSNQGGTVEVEPVE